MSNKLAFLIFSVTVLLVSSAIVAIPQANALTKGNTMKNISTASYGNSMVCGDHKCAPGEHTKWYNAIWQSQKENSGKIGTTYHGDDVMDKLAKSNATSNAMPGTGQTPVNEQTAIRGYK